MEDLLASIRRAIHDDIGDMPSSTAGQSKGVVFQGNMRELRVKVGDEASAAAVEIQDLREKINRRASEVRNDDPELLTPRRLAGRPPPSTLRPSFAEADTRSLETLQGESYARFAREAGAGFWDDERQALGSQAEDPGMLSVEAEATAGNAFNKLAQTLLNRPAGGQPIEDMTRELLRGMLKHWLDANLPNLVERLVREEIERVGRRGR
ncbi:MAG: DUF2497 domain-containing protein [Rhizobiales bacterium]|nr:DUF2497 domain-containing protein [Hyphomicrobiales bacterium]